MKSKIYVVLMLMAIIILGCQKDIEPPVVVKISTSGVSQITETSAVSGGIIEYYNREFSITARGVCWSTTQNPTINNEHTTDGIGNGVFTSKITGLQKNVTYYVRSYVVINNNTTYGEEKSFVTINGVPIVTTNNITNIKTTTATCGGIVTNDGGFAVTARGVCWSTTQNPTIANAHTTNGSGTGSFTSNITGLTQGTTYYVRAYAKNSKGTVYGEQRSFTTELTGTWTQIAPCPANTYKIETGFAVNGKGYIVYEGDILYEGFYYYYYTYQYNPSTNSWTQKSSSIYSNVPPGCGFTINGKGYVVICDVNSSLWSSIIKEYNPSTDSWVEKYSTPFSLDLFTRAVFTISNNIYIIDNERVFEYNTATNTLTQKANMPNSNNRNSPFAFSIGTKGYAGGGSGINGDFFDFYEYNPSSNSWTQKSQCPHKSYPINNLSFCIGSLGYVIGGDNSKTISEYNPTTDKWTQKKDLPLACHNIAFAIDNGAIVRCSSNTWFKFIP